MSDASGHYLPLALTIGEPAGVGLELTARIWHERLEHPVPPFFLIGPADALAATRSAPPAETIEAVVEKSEGVELPPLVRGFMATYSMMAWNSVVESGVWVTSG